MERAVKDEWTSAGEREQKILTLHAFCRLFCGMIPGEHQQFCSDVRLPQLVAPHTTALFRADARVPNRIVWRLLVTADVIKNDPASPKDIVLLLESVLGFAVDLSVDIAKLLVSVFEPQGDASLSFFLCFFLFLLNDAKAQNGPEKFLNGLFDLIERYCG